MRNANRTWDTPVWVSARADAAERGMKAAYDCWGTTGYMDEDMQFVTPVKVLPPVAPKNTIRMRVKRLRFAGGID